MDFDAENGAIIVYYFNLLVVTKQKIFKYVLANVNIIVNSVQ